MTGYGTLSCNGTTVYKGNWRNYKYHGDGVLVRRGDTYAGNFGTDVITTCTLTTANGDAYSCDTWREGAMNGYGTFSRKGNCVQGH